MLLTALRRWTGVCLSRIRPHRPCGVCRYDAQGRRQPAAQRFVQHKRSPTWDRFSASRHSTAHGCPWGVGPASVRMGSDPTDPVECAGTMHKAVGSRQHKDSSNTRGLQPGTDFRQVDTLRPMGAPGALDRRLFAWDPTPQTLRDVPVQCSCPGLTPHCT